MTRRQERATLDLTVGAGLADRDDWYTPAPMPRPKVAATPPMPSCLVAWLHAG
ncbi:MAG: hypothetical protein U0794_08200 [Isosphaeraceae bacterium]